MGKTPLVTIAIPVYNAEKYIKYAIKSTLNQSYKNIELILINDGSTDKSLSIINSFKDRSCVRIVNDGINRGLIFRLNQSIELAQGELYARMDADDIMHPSRIEKQVAALLAEPSVDVIGTGLYSIDTNNKVRGVRYPKKFPSKNFIAHKCFAHPTVMGRIEWFRNNNYSMSALRQEDKELWARTVNSSVFRNITEPLLYYREVGIPVYPKLLRGYKNKIRSIEKINLKTMKSLIASITRIIVYFFFNLFRAEYLVVLMRSKRLKRCERLKAEEILSRFCY